MLVIIPARGGSKGVPGKNIKELGGKPLIQYTIEAAKELFEDSQIIISTDCNDIKETVENFGLKVPFLRPAHLATDTAGTYEVLLHALKYAENYGFNPETLLLLQPTSPFRNAAHIREAVELYNSLKSELEMLVSVKETKANPYYLLKEENENGFLENSKIGNFTRRQDCPKVWELNGAIYIINVASLKKKTISDFKNVKKFVMDEYSSHDIDTMMDWKFAEFLISNI
ncbi:cytidylyltransferase domain-containing protein [Christiangramia portivictoriae]|uniref:acylneuraminate cytidylyltransferase family protein n=1 Tax=Christiangramia portivictoriae TaxID=326069 RepID=UPI000419C8EB|nr:acylneuraminate cytidylyltransferase family protein [Christiangramia portivictoriae]